MRGLTQNEIDATMLSVGSHKVARPLSPVEVAYNCEKARKAEETKKGIAAGLGLTGTTMIDKFLKLLRLDPEILHLVDWGDSKFSVIGFSCASEFVQLPLDIHKEMAKAVCQFGLTKVQTKSVRQLFQRSKRPLDECISDVVARQSVVVVREIVIGEIVDEALSQCLVNMLQSERDMLLIKVLKEVYPAIGDFTAKLGKRRFTVIGGKSVGETLGRDTNFEGQIHQALADRVHKNV